MCQIHTGAYVSLLAPEKTDYTSCHPRKTTTYILHVVSIATHTHDGRKSIGKKKQRKEKKIQEWKEKRRKQTKKKKRKEKTRQENQEKTRQEEEARKGKEKRPQELTKDGIGVIEGIKYIINGTGERTQHGGEVRAVLRYLVTAIGRPTTFKTMMSQPRLLVSWA